MSCQGVGSIGVGAGRVGGESCEESETPVDSGLPPGSLILPRGIGRGGGGSGKFFMVALTMERGIRWANVPDGKAEMVVHGGPRVWHVNSVANVHERPVASIERDGEYSGAIKFRFRDYRRFAVPSKIVPENP